MKRENFSENKAKKRIEAKIRQEMYDKLSKEEKIQKLDEKLGKDVGAVKERGKLNKKK